MAAELDLALRLPLDLSEDEFLDLAIGGPADDFAFALFHESDEEESPRADTITTELKNILIVPELESVPRDGGGGDEVKTDNCKAVEESLTLVEKTYYMVNSYSSRLIGWNATGTGFLIVDTDRFSREVLPKFFKHRNMNQFVVELTLHGFRKSSLHHKRLGVRCMEFRHPYFVRGGVEQLAKIERRVPVSVPREAACSTATEDTTWAEDTGSGEEPVGDLRFQISELQGEVQQTQDLFDKLLVSLMQQHAAQPIQAMMAQAHPPFIHPFGVVHLPHAFFTPVAFGMGPPMTFAPRVADVQAPSAGLI